MSYLRVAFWIAAAVLAYTYVGYPLLIGILARWRGRPVRKGTYQGSFSILIAAHNEERTIDRRLTELLAQIHRTGLPAEIIVAADGCTDATVEKAQRHPVRVLALDENVGKSAALTEAARLATGDVLLFADARQTWADDAIPNLLGNFSDSDVGAVSGDLMLEAEPGVLAGVGLYWRFEKWLRKQESLIHSQVGVTGAIAAVRRHLFHPIPPGTVLDDVYWPLKVAMAGHRVVHDDSAHAFDRLPDRSSAEFRRKVRTLAGNFQLAALIPSSLVPWRNPVWMAWLSHKLSRLASPWALMTLAVTSALIGGPFFATVLAVQAACYAVAIAGLTPVLKRSRLAGAAASFVVLNAAAWVAFWVWIFGRTGRSWRKTHYREPVETITV